MVPGLGAVGALDGLPPGEHQAQGDQEDTGHAGDGGLHVVAEVGRHGEVGGAYGVRFVDGYQGQQRERAHDFVEFLHFFLILVLV